MQIEEAAKDMLRAVEQVDADERAISLRKRLLAAVNRLLVGCAKSATLLSVRLRHDHVRSCQRAAAACLLAPAQHAICTFMRRFSELSPCVLPLLLQPTKSAGLARRLAALHKQTLGQLDLAVELIGLVEDFRKQVFILTGLSQSYTPVTFELMRRSQREPQAPHLSDAGELKSDLEMALDHHILADVLQPAVGGWEGGRKDSGGFYIPPRVAHCPRYLNAALIFVLSKRVAYGNNCTPAAALGSAPEPP
jgi:hypothetical protein